jgi:hypothetical protein
MIWATDDGLIGATTGLHSTRFVRWTRSKFFTGIWTSNARRCLQS